MRQFKRFIFVVIFFVPFLMSAQEKGTRIASEIKQVTVFLNQAQINRTAKTKLKAGSNVIIFEKLPTQIDPKSIQVSGKGNFTILSVSFQTNYLAIQEPGKDVQKLESALQTLNRNIKTKEALREVIVSEETMIKANQAVGGSQTGLKTAELREAADFYRSRLSDIKTRMVKATDELDSLKKESQRLTAQLNSMRAELSAPTGEVVVNITAPAEVQASLDFSYMVYDAGWIPSYDIRATDVTSPVNLICKANVYQNTGELWKNVMLTLSTGNPTQSGSKPYLQPWYLGFDYPVPVSASNVVQAKGRVMKVAEVEEIMILEDSFMADEKAKTPAQYTVQRDAMTNVEFSVDIPYTVFSGESLVVEYKKHELPATFEYYAVRKLDKDAFLVAKITNWMDLNLLSGETNLFFEGTYVGASYLDIRTITDTLKLSMGRDKGIIITRVKGKDFTTKQLLGSSQKDTRVWDITVRNTKKQPVNIVLEDQVPVSTTKEIEVEAVEISQAVYDKETGKLTWRLTLQPSESKNLKIQYTVKYPKNKRVILE